VRYWEFRLRRFWISSWLLLCYDYVSLYLAGLALGMSPLAASVFPPIVAFLPLRFRPSPVGGRERILNSVRARSEIKKNLPNDHPKSYRLHLKKMRRMNRRRSTGSKKDPTAKGFALQDFVYFAVLCV